MYQFPPPSRVRDFDLQNAIGKTERMSPIRNHTAAGHRPRKQCTLTRGRSMKSLCDDGFEAGGSAVQRVTPKIAAAI